LVHLYFRSKQMPDEITIVTAVVDPIDEKTRSIVNGVAQILKYERSATFATEHDVLYFGSYLTSEQMTAEELQSMDDWGWFEEYESWAIHT
jgi:hypothetical protein